MADITSVGIVQRQYAGVLRDHDQIRALRDPCRSSQPHRT